MFGDPLLDDIKDLLRRSIASSLKIAKSDYDASLDTQTAVNECLSMIMAIGYNDTLDGAIDDICKFRSGYTGSEFPRNVVQKEIIACQNTFRSEVAGFKKMHDMKRREMEPADIWSSVIFQISISPEYCDDWLKQAEARYQRLPR